MPSNASGPTSGASSDDKATRAESPQPEATQDETPQASPYDLVRVKNTRTGVEYSVARVVASGSKDLQILKGKPVVDNYGNPLPVRSKPTHRTDLAGQPAQEA